MNDEIYDEKSIIDYYFTENSPFIDEGKIILIEEFGKEYGTYFSILELMAEGRTSRTEIESILEKNIGGYLDKLDSLKDIKSKYGVYFVSGNHEYFHGIKEISLYLKTLHVKVVSLMAQSLCVTR